MEGIVKVDEMDVKELSLSLSFSLSFSSSLLFFSSSSRLEAKCKSTCMLEQTLRHKTDANQRIRYTGLRMFLE